MRGTTRLDESSPASEQQLLVLERISKSLGHRTVLNGVSLTVGAGELVVLLGPNGAGKTTLLGTACGRIAPDEGRARVAGGDPRRDSTVRRQLGFVPQELALYPYLSVRENLQVFGRMMGVSGAQLAERVAAALAWSGLTDRLRDRVDTLSGGMQRRLNIVASLLHQPALVMLDEPTAGVDVNARERIHKLLRNLRTEGLALLLTTHDLPQATDLADRVVFMVAGEIRLQGPPEVLIEQVFGAGKELTVTLDQPPDTVERETLRSLGFVAGSGLVTWTGTVSDGYDGVTAWHQRLTADGFKVAELRVREPSLEGVFLRVTGEELKL